MNTWLYRFLNAQAKAWPYYKHDRAKQRGSIKSHLHTVRSVLATKDAYCVVSHTGDVSVQYEEQQSYNGLYSHCSVTGMSLDWAAAFIRLGVPVIDCQPADFARLCKVSISGPMIAVGHQSVDKGKYGALNYQSLRTVATSYQQAGCVVTNLFEDDNWDEPVQITMDMFLPEGGAS